MENKRKEIKIAIRYEKVFFDNIIDAGDNGF